MNRRGSELNISCRSLPASNTAELTNTCVSESYCELEDLFCKFGYADVISELSSLWSIEKAVEFFNKVPLVSEKLRDIHTVAVFYIRGYNGGIERVNAELMDLWVEMGYKVVFFTDEPENSFDFPYSKAIKRIVIPSRDYLPARLKELQKHCEREKVDVFINHNWNDGRSVWECILIKAMGIRYVQYCHGHFSWCFVKGKLALYQPEAFKLCDLTVALSETNARFYQMCGCNSYLVQNPVPSDLMNASASRTAESHRILLVGRISEEKYPMEALNIFKCVHDSHPEAVLDIVGDGEDVLVSQMREFVSVNALDQAVLFHGNKSNDEVAGYYKNACCVLFTSKMEGYPMVVLEAKAFGLPLIMYDMPFLSLTKDNKGILTAKPGDINTMAENLSALFDDRGLRDKLCNEASESFDSIKSYPVKNAWQDIFDLCCGNQIESDAYYKPDKLSYPDMYIIPALLDKIKDGYHNTFTSSRDYKLGSALLNIPRKVKRILKNGK